MQTYRYTHALLYLLACYAIIFLSVAVVAADPPPRTPLVIALDADLSGGSAQSGEAIRRGALLAIEEINAAGGILEHPVTLMVRDHRGNPARSLENMREFAATPRLLAVLGGLHTPVALAVLPVVHEHEIIFLIPWAAGTPIIDNHYVPNYVFRVSVRDEYAGAFLVEQALAAGYRRPGLLLEQTGWGRSNERAMLHALEQRGAQAAAVEWFHWGTSEVRQQLEHLRAAGADVVLLVANAPEGLAALQSMARLPESERLTIVSHWGITGGEFALQAGQDLAAVNLFFLQTFLFTDPPRIDAGARLRALYQEAFAETRPPQYWPAPPGTAHAYDLVHLLAQAVEQAGTWERSAIREALTQLETHDGVMRYYAPPFTPQRHDALNMDDFIIACFGEHGAILPCSITPAGD